MPTISALPTDGHDSAGLQSSWDNAHDSTGHPFLNPDTDLVQIAISRG